MRGIGSKYKFVALTLVTLLVYGLVMAKRIQPTLHKLWLVQKSSGGENLKEYQNKRTLISGQVLELEKALDGGLGSVEIQHYLMSVIGEFDVANEVDLYEFHEPHSMFKDQFLIVNQRVEVEGSFNAVVKLIDKIEKSEESIFIRNIELETKKNHATKRKELHAIICVQSVETI